MSQLEFPIMARNSKHNISITIEYMDNSTPNKSYASRRNAKNKTVQMGVWKKKGKYWIDNSSKFYIFFYFYYQSITFSRLSITDY